MRPISLTLLADVFATFAPMDAADARRRAATAVETLEATQGRADLLQIGLALQALELGPLHRFSRASQPDRERALLAWATSSIPQRRTAFQVLKRFALFLAYADPGPDPAAPRNDAWTSIGYRPPARPSNPASSLLQPWEVERSGTDPLLMDADVVVVGSGAGGGVVAARVAAAGRTVIVLEAGGHRPESEMPVSEADAWREMLLDRGTTSTVDLSVTILAGSTLGGGTTVNWTTLIRPPDWVRDEWETTHGLSGVGSDETDADLDRLEVELDALPPTTIPPKDQLILDGARALGWEADLTRRNAGPCTECGGCAFGCQRGAKRSGLRTHLAAAGSAGARIVVGARVSQLVHRGGTVEGVVGRLEPAGRRFVVRAPQVVLAAGALRTPVALRRSGLDHPAIGAHLRLHPTVAVTAELSGPAEAWRGPLQAARCLQFARSGPASADGVGGAHGGFVIEAAPPHPGLAMAALPWSGRADAVARAESLRRLVPLIAIIRDEGGGRVRPAGGGRSRISYRLGVHDAATARRALVEMARLARAGNAAGIRAVATPGRGWRDGEGFDAFLAELDAIDTGPNRLSLFSAHQMGSARAGADPRSSATDPWGRVRADRGGSLLRGAYVADGSLLPTAPGVNPMLTIMAFAERVARAIISDRA